MQAQRRAATPPFSARQPERRSGDDGDDLQAAGLDDDDLVIHHEIQEPAPRGMDDDDFLRNRDEMHGFRDHGAHAGVEVHVGHAVDAAGLEHRLLDLRPLFGRQRRGGGCRAALARLLLGLALAGPRRLAFTLHVLTRLLAFPLHLLARLLAVLTCPRLLRLAAAVHLALAALGPALADGRTLARRCALLRTWGA